MCVIVASGDPKTQAEIEVEQVIEALCYSREGSSVRIRLELLVHSSQQGASLLLAHRAHVTGNLSRSLPLHSVPKDRSGTALASREDVLAGVYDGRFVRDKDGVSFLERRNCFRVEDTATVIDHVDPVLRQDVLLPRGQNDAPGAFPPFTAIEVAGIDKGRTWFAMDLDLKGPSYDYLIGTQDRFWVDGPDRVLAQIREEDIPQRGYLSPEAQTLLDSRLVPGRLTPKAYDIVIFGPGVEGVSDGLVSTPLTGDVYRAPVENGFAKAKAELFVTRSLAFWVDLCFDDTSRATGTFPRRRGRELRAG